MIEVIFGLAMFGFGIGLAHVLWSDDRGKFYIPKSTQERSGWIHDGKLYTYERHMDENSY